MESESACIFSSITRLCEKILDESWKHNDRPASRTLRIKKLRTKAYGTLLIPGNNEFPHSPHDCFVKVISAAVESKAFQDNNFSMEEFDGYVDHLWQEASKRSFIPPMVYFLSKMVNEKQVSDVDENENFYSKGISSSVAPRKYHVYHPTSFDLPSLHNALSRYSKVNCLTNSQFSLNNQFRSVRPVCNFQFDIISTKFSGKKIKHPSSAFPSISRDQNDIIWNHLKDEGYESTETTPLTATPAELNALPWYEYITDLRGIQKGQHRTWESLGQPVHAIENPPLLEAPIEGFHSNLKIQEKLLLTLEPRLSLQFRDPINQKTLLHHVMCLLIGLESESFVFNEDLDRFELAEGVWLQDVSHEALKACLADVTVMGTCFHRLLYFVESTDGHRQGVVLQAIKKCTRHYLHLYQGVCILVMQDLLRMKSVPLLLMRVKLRSLQEQILCLARAYGLWGNGPPLPTGVEVLSHLHRHASCTQRPQVASLFHYILHAGCLVYFSILERWVFDGEVIDERDFFVMQRIEYLTCRNRRFWTRAFQCNSATVPEFLCGLKQFLLRCGKSVNFLKSCDPKHPSLENSQSLLTSMMQSCHHSVSNDGLIKECVADMKICTGVEESTVCEDKEGNIISEVEEANVESTESKSLEETKKIRQVICSSPEVNAEKLDVDKLKALDLEPRKLSQQVKDEMMMEKIIEEEKEKLREYYGKLGEASDRRREKAEWRSRRMILRTKESASCSAVTQEDGDSESEEKESVIVSLNEASALQKHGTDDGAVPATAEDVEESTDVVKVVNEMNAEETFSETKNKDNSKGEDEGTVDVTAVSENAAEVEGNEIAAEDIVEMVNPVVEIGKDGGKEEFTDQNEEDRADADSGILEECITDMPSSNVCLPFLKSPSRSKLKKIQGLFPFKSDSQPEDTEEPVNNQELPPEWPYRSLLLALMVQSSKMDAALLQWMLVEKGLVSHLRSVRAYFFLLDGEFGRRLSEDLFSAMRRAPGGKPSIECLNELSLSRILSHALASSTFAASDSNAELLSLALSQCPEKAQVGDPLACVHMQYKVPWPLNVVLTEEAVSKYSRVLDLLLRLRHASWALEQTFLHLRVLEPGKGIDKVFPRRWRSPHEAVQNSPQYHQLQLYRHQMMHLVRSVQNYITSGVLQASGKKLDEIIAGSSCLDEFYTEHVLYVKKILFGCMLNRRSETIANILNDILRLIMKFHWSLCSRSWHIPPDQGNKKTCHYEHPNFNVLRRIHAAFEEMTDFLLKYAWRLASHGYQASLFELLQMINVNNFY